MLKFNLVDGCKSYFDKTKKKMVKMKYKTYFIGNKCSNFYLALNSCPVCTLNSNKTFCDHQHILFGRPSYYPNRNILFARFSRSWLLLYTYFYPDIRLLLNSRSLVVTSIIFSFVHNAGFLI